MATKGGDTPEIKDMTESDNRPKPKPKSEPSAWTDIDDVYFKFQKHYNPFFKEIHQLLDTAYAQAIPDIDVIFEDGPRRTTIRKDAVGVLRNQIVRQILPLARDTTDKSLVSKYLEDLPLLSKIANGAQVNIQGPADIRRVLQNARNDGNNTVVIHLDIGTLYFKPTTSANDYFNPRRFEDMSLTPFPVAARPTPRPAPKNLQQRILERVYSFLDGLLESRRRSLTTSRLAGASTANPGGATKARDGQTVSLGSMTTLIWVTLMLSIGFSIGFFRLITANPQCLEAISDAETVMGWRAPPTTLEQSFFDDNVETSGRVGLSIKK